MSVLGHFIREGDAQYRDLFNHSEAMHGRRRVEKVPDEEKVGLLEVDPEAREIRKRVDDLHGCIQ